MSLIKILTVIFTFTGIVVSYAEEVEVLTAEQIKDRLNQGKIVTFKTLSYSDIDQTCKLHYVGGKVSWVYSTTTLKKGGKKLETTSYIAPNNENYYTMSGNTYEARDPLKIRDVYVQPWLRFSPYFIDKGALVQKPLTLDGKTFYKIKSSVSEKAFDRFLNSSGRRESREVYELFLFKRVLDRGFIKRYGSKGGVKPGELVVPESAKKLIKKSKGFPLDVEMVYESKSNSLISILLVSMTGEVVGSYNVQAKFEPNSPAPPIPVGIKKTLKGSKFREMRAEKYKQL